jgi:hypothetical protein
MWAVDAHLAIKQCDANCGWSSVERHITSSMAAIIGGTSGTAASFELVYSKPQKNSVAAACFRDRAESSPERRRSLLGMCRVFVQRSHMTASVAARRPPASQAVFSRGREGSPHGVVMCPAARLVGFRGHDHRDGMPGEMSKVETVDNIQAVAGRVPEHCSPGGLLLSSRCASGQQLV